MNVCYLLNQCMANITSFENRKLEQTLIHLSSNYASNKTILHIVVILERILREGVCYDQGYNAYFSLAVIEQIWETNQNFVKPLLGSLAVFAKEIANKQAKGQQAINASSM